MLRHYIHDPDLGGHYGSDCGDSVFINRLRPVDRHLADTMCHVRRTAYATVVSDTAVRVVDMLNAYRHDDAEPLANDLAEITSPLSHAVDQVAIST